MFWPKEIWEDAKKLEVGRCRGALQHQPLCMHVGLPERLEVGTAEGCRVLGARLFASTGPYLESGVRPGLSPSFLEAQGPRRGADPIGHCAPCAIFFFFGGLV